MNPKDFDSWNTLKKSLHSQLFSGGVHEGEIWWCSIGVNIGSEQDGKNDLFERPALVLKKFNNEILWTVPLSSKIKTNPYSLVLKDESVLLSQLRLVSTRRLSRMIKRIAPDELERIRDRLIELLKADKFQTPA